MIGAHSKNVANSPGSTNRRRFTVAAAAALGSIGMVACTGDNKAQSTPTPEITPTPVITQEPVQPTQPPISTPVAGYLDPTRWEGRSLVVASPALGTPLDSLKEAFLDAFASATGAVVRHQELGRDSISNLIDQVDSGDVVWDVVLIPTEDVLPIAQQQYLAAIDYNVVDATALFSECNLQHGVAARIYSTVIVYPTQAPVAPDGWGDFWDLSLFDGTRALRRSPIGTLEFALLADGVTLDRIYPLDTARAFDALNRIRDAIQFYEDSKLPVEFVRSGQVGLASAWNVRTALPDVQSLVKIVWDGGMLASDSWVIPRGSRNMDVAMSFLNFATRAVPTANYSRLEDFGPVNREAFSLLRPDIVATLPNNPKVLGKQFFQNWSYWAENREFLTAQFEDWLLNPIASPGARSESS